VYLFPLQARPLLFVFVKLSEIVGISCLAQSWFHVFITYFLKGFTRKEKLFQYRCIWLLKNRNEAFKTATNINHRSLHVSAWHVSQPDNVNCVQNCTWLYLMYSVSKSFFFGKTIRHLGFESYNRWWCNALGKTRENESMQNLLCGYSDRQTTFICVWLKLKLNSFRDRATHKIFWWRLSWTVHPSDRSWKQYSELTLEATCGS